MTRVTAVAAVAVLTLALVAAGRAPGLRVDATARAAVVALEESVAPLPSVTTPRPSPAPTPDPRTTVVATAPTIGTTPEGFEVLLGTGEVVGTSERLVTYSIEREAGLDIPMSELVDEVEAALHDTERGWTVAADVSLQRVASGAEVRIVLADPSTVDQYCLRVGLRTNGRYSCWADGFAMLSADRFTNGASTHTDVGVYRRYLVNHEVGHGIGQRHTNCPAAGAPAPVMMQQTKTIGACIPNGHPHTG